MIKESCRRMEELPPGAKILIFCDAPTGNTTNGSQEAHRRTTTGVKTTLVNIESRLIARGYAVQSITPDLFPTEVLPFMPEVPLARVKPKALRKKITAYQPDAIVNMSPEGSVGSLGMISCALYPQKRLEGKNKHGLPYVASYTTNVTEYINKRLEGMSQGLLSVPDFVSGGVIRSTYKRAHGVMVPTERLGGWLHAVGIKKTILWERGVDSQLFRPLRSGEQNAYEHYDWYAGLPVLLSYGRISPEKGLEDFLSLRTPGFHKVVIGDGPQRQELEAKYGRDTHFLGKRFGTDLAHHVRSARLKLFPSTTDTWGQVVTEAAASGVPVVAFNVQGPADVLTSGINGVLVSVGKSLDTGIREALQLDRQKCADYTGARYSWDKATDILVANLSRIKWKQERN